MSTRLRLKMRARSASPAMDRPRQCPHTGREETQRDVRGILPSNDKPPAGMDILKLPPTAFTHMIWANSQRVYKTRI